MTDHAQAIPTDPSTDPSTTDCAFTLVRAGDEFFQFFYPIQQIVALSTKMVNSIDKKTVLEAFHQEAFRFIDYVEQMRKVHDGEMQRPARERTCQQTATMTQQLLDLERDIAAVIREMDGRLIGLPSKR